MTRKDFLRAAALAPAASSRAAEPVIRKNARFELSLDTSAGLTVRLRDLVFERVLAEGPYSYSFGSPKFPGVDARGGAVTLRGMAPGRLEVTHEFRVPEGKPWIEERIVVANRGRQTLLMPYARAGFVLPLSEEEQEAAWR